MAGPALLEVGRHISKQMSRQGTSPVARSPTVQRSPTSMLQVEQDATKLLGGQQQAEDSSVEIPATRSHRVADVATDLSAVIGSDAQQTREHKLVQLQNAIIREACLLAPLDRQPEHVDYLLEFVHQNPLLEGMDEGRQRSLCQVMTLETYKNETIFQEGDEADKFYMVLTGTAAVLMYLEDCECPRALPAHEQRCTCPDREVEEQITLTRQRSFGELALMQVPHRVTTVKAIDSVELLCLNKVDFEGDLHRAAYGFFQRVPLLEQGLIRQLFTDQDLRQLVASAQEQTYTGHELLCKQGAFADKVVFVRRGSCAVVREVHVNQEGTCLATDGGVRKSRGRMTRLLTENLKDEGEDEKTPSPRPQRRILPELGKPSKDPSTPVRKPQRQSTVRLDGGSPRVPRTKTQATAQRDDRRTSAGSTATRASLVPADPGTKKLIVRIGILGKYDVFGLEETLAPAPYKLSLVCDSIAHVYVLSRDLARRLPRRLTQALISGRDPLSLPGCEEMLAAARESERWQRWKEQFGARPQPRLVTRPEPVHLRRADYEQKSCVPAAFVRRMRGLEQLHGVEQEEPTPPRMSIVAPEAVARKSQIARPSKIGDLSLDAGLRLRAPGQRQATADACTTARHWHRLQYDIGLGLCGNNPGFVDAERLRTGRPSCPALARVLEEAPGHPDPAVERRASQDALAKQWTESSPQSLEGWGDAVVELRRMQQLMKDQAPDGPVGDPPAIEVTVTPEAPAA